MRSSPWRIRCAVVAWAALATCLSIVCPVTGTTDSRSGLHPASIVTSNVANGLLKQAISAYQVNNVLDITTAVFPSTTTITAAYMTGAYDLGVATTGFTATDQAKNPNAAIFPIIGNAVAIGYNIGTDAGGAQLILPVDVMCDIEIGVVQWWNDTRIQSVNPLLVMPKLGITVVHLSVSAGSNDAYTSLCSKISPAFKALVGRTLGPVWPTSRYYKSTTGSSSDVVASTIVDTLGSFGCATLQNMISIGCKISALQNSAGAVVTPTLNSISLNILELASNGIPAGQTQYDLTNPTSPNAWPMCTLLYLWLDTVSPLSTCATKTAVLKFLLWFYSDSSVKLLAQALNMAVVPDLYVTQIGLISQLQSDVKCQGQTMVSTSSDKAFIEGFGSVASLISSYSNYYKSVVTTTTYTYSAGTEPLVTHRVVANEIDLAIVNTRQLASDDVTLMTEGELGAFVPAFISGVVITYTLPTTLSVPWGKWTATTSTLPSLLPLVLDMETVASIFVGAISTWNDSAIIATNPQLAKWLAAYPTTRLAFKTIACCTNTADAQSAGILLMQGLNNTAIASTPAYSSYFYLPLSWAQQDLADTSNHWDIIDIEARMTPRATATQIAGSSAISYRLISTAVTDPTTEFRIVQTVGGVTESLAPQPSNFETCATVGLAAGKLTDPSYRPGPIAGCYPLSTTLSVGINLAYTTAADSCTHGNRSLNLLSWITNTDALSGAATNAGILRLADLSQIQASTNVILNTATCDGATLLITLPRYWSVNSAIFGFGVAVMVMGFVCFIASAVILLMYRTRSVLRSSSVPFLGLILFGLTLFVSSVAAWSHQATNESCGAFMWLANIGFSLVFVPFFAKTYRIYAIFSRQKLKVIKMSNTRLMALVGGLIGAELVLLLAWSQVSPLKPIEYLRNVSGTYHQATHCSVDSEGMKFVIVEAVYKACLLIAGTMLAFSTRKVSTAFNESSAIAFAIYNVLFSAIIVGAIIYFVNAFEDTLVLLFLFLIFWVSLVTWGLLFGQKFYVMFSQSEEDAAVMSKMSSLQTEKSAGFSFVSVINMPPNMIKGYVAALEGQLAKARKQLAVVFATTGQYLGAGTTGGVAGGATGPSKRNMTTKYSGLGDNTTGGQHPHRSIGDDVGERSRYDDLPKSSLRSQLPPDDSPTNTLPQGLEAYHAWAPSAAPAPLSIASPSAVRSPISLAITVPTTAPATPTGAGDKAAGTSPVAQSAAAAAPTLVGAKRSPLLVRHSASGRESPVGNEAGGEPLMVRQASSDDATLRAAAAATPSGVTIHVPPPTAASAATSNPSPMSTAVRPSSRAIQAQHTLLD